MSIAEDLHPVDSALLSAMMDDIFARLGTPQRERVTVVETLLEASLAGYDSHGIMRVPLYVDGIRQGAILPAAPIRTLRESVASAYLDGGWGLGPVTATYALELAGAKARAVGVGCVSVVGCNDVARLGGYMAAPARAGLIALMMVNDAGGGPSVVPWGGVDPVLSTNPLAAGIARPGQPPLVIDISTSVVAYGKLRMAVNRGQSVPAGWIVNRQGQAETDPTTFFAAAPTSALLPLGGPVAGHKGFALGLLVDILAGGLSGAGVSSGQPQAEERNGLFVLVIDPDHFASRANLAHSVEQLVRTIKASRPAPGVEEILLPGERAARERARRLQAGIPLDATIRRQLGEIRDGLGLAARYPLP